MNLTIQSPILVFTNLVFVFLLYKITKPAYVTYRLNANRRHWSIFLSVIFCLLSFWGKDWFGYLLYYTDIQKGFEIDAMEQIYNYIGRYCPNYLFFRLAIWGPALFFLYKTIKIMQINRDVAIFFFCVFFLMWFSYSRASLAMATMFYGYSLLLTSKKRFSIVSFVGLLFIIGSFYLHKSSIIAIVAIIIAEVLKGTNKKISVILPIVLFPIAIFFLMTHFDFFLDTLLEDEGNMILNEYATVGNSYLNADKFTIGPGFILQSFLERLPYYLLSYLCAKSLLSKDRSIPIAIQQFMLLFIVLILVASVFAFDLGLNTSAVYGRMMRYLQIPACIILTYSYTNNLYPKLTRYICRILFISTIYCFVYVLYNSYMAQ